jgi:hypothetical protein
MFPINEFPRQIPSSLEIGHQMSIRNREWPMYRCKLSLTLVCLALLFSSNPSLADEWHSPDERVLAETPSSSRFAAHEPSAANLAKWVSNNGKIKLLIKERGVSPKVKMTLSDLEKGLIAEIDSTMKDGQLLDSNMREYVGYETYTLIGKGQNGNTSIYLSESVIVRYEKCYTAVAVGIGIDPRTDSDADAFINSFKVLTSKQTFQSNSTTSLQSLTANSSKEGNGDNSAKSDDRNTIRIVFLILRIVAVICVSGYGANRARRNLRSS